MLPVPRRCLLGPGIEYREYLPDPRLDAEVEYLWTMNATQPLASPLVQTSACKATLDLILTLEGNFCSSAEQHLFGTSGRGAYLVGVMSAPRDIVTAGRCSTVGVRFRQGRAGAFLGLPLHELTDRALALATVSTKLERCISAVGAGGNGSNERVRQMQRVLLEAYQPRCVASDQGAVAAAVRLIADRGGGIGVAELARSVGCGVRTLERRFRELVGIGPKLVCRMARVKRAMALLPGSAGGRFTDIVYSCGFSDQAHFIREFRALAGVTPARFARDCRALPHGAYLSHSYNTPASVACIVSGNAAHIG